MPKDRVGNEIKVGDLVAFQLSQQISTGIIKEVRTGGTILAPKARNQQPEMTAGEIIVVHEVRYLYDPTVSNPHVQELFKLINPEAKQIH